MKTGDNDDDHRTVFCGNLSQDVTDAILYELFLQAGPVESVRRPKDQNGRPKSFAFVLYKHECSVPYALQLFRGTQLFNRNLNLNSRSTLEHIPVLDTHLNEFIQAQSFQDNDYTNRDYHREKNHRNESRDKHKRSNKERDQDEPKSWAELNSLRGRGSISNGHFRDDLQGTSKYKNESSPRREPTVIPDFNALLQMGQQLIFNGSLGFPGTMPMAGMVPMIGFDPSLGGINTFPSMQGRESGGERKSPDRHRYYQEDRGRRDYHEDRGRRMDYQEDRGRRRDHPYNDRRSYDHWDDHRRHDRGYSSSRSSHERERRDRRSR